jgi:hypothetical protein
MVGITGAFAGICLTLYFFNTSMLQLLLQDQFHPMILAAGITLLIVTLVRAAVLWQAAGKKSAVHTHTHDLSHEHHHEHEHEHVHGAQCSHDHHHEHHDHELHQHVHDASCGHDHHHHSDEHVQAGVAVYHSPALPMVAHDHHGHSHGADDGHDHGWAPWRYVVLLVPLMLFLLGLPNKAMPLGNPGMGDISQEAAQAIRLVGLQANPLVQASFAAALSLHADDKVAPITVDGNLVSITQLEPGMKVWLKLVLDDKVEGKRGASAVWASKDSGSPAASKDVPWTPMGVIKRVDPKENTLTVAASKDSQSEETFDLEATVYIEYKQLEQAAFSPGQRARYDGKKVQVVGMFNPVDGSDRFFYLAGRSMQCCAADAITLNVQMYCKESLNAPNKEKLQKEDWVRVTGRVQFRQDPNRPGIYRTVLVINRRDNIVKTAALSPYVK